MKNPFLIYGRAGEPCQTCGATVASSEQGGRTTHFCPRCQPARRAPRPTTPRPAKARRRS